MGTHYGGNGGNGGDPPPDGDRSQEPELPPLPPEWGRITIPEDPSELAEEAEEVRRELTQERTSRWNRRIPGVDRLRIRPMLGPPLLIVAVAVMITIASLVVMAWSGANGDRATGPTGRTVPTVTLTDHAGRPVPIADQAPMALLLVENCDCQQLITETVAAAPPGVRVVAVGNTPPDPVQVEPNAAPPIRLADPNGLLRTQLELGPPTEAAAVALVDPQGQVAHIVPVAVSVATYEREMARLSG